MNKTRLAGFAQSVLSNARACRTACFRPTTLALLFLTFLFAVPAKATHVVGGQLSYTFLSTNGASNTYRIRLSLFRDCAGVNLPGTASVALFNNNTGSQLAVLNLGQQGTLIDRSIVCPGQQSRCTNVNSTIPGVQEFIYEGNYTVAAATTFPIRVAHSTCCRANGITNLSNPGNQETYLSTIIPAQNLNLNNNSPVFLNPPNGVFCQNQLASLSLNAFDPDGDALVYSLVSARRGTVTSPQNCLYAGTFTPTSPMSSSTPVTINPATGVINFTPSVLNQRSVVAVRVEEFRNGNKIGEVFRDLEVTTISCGSNTAPLIAPINNQVVQVGQTLCIPVSVTDANNHNITVTASGGIIPPATFTITSSGPGFTNGQFCFTPTLANAANTYAISINAVDNFCPIPSSVVSTFNITVPCPNAIPLQTSSTPASCGLSDGSATASMPGGVPPFAYSWTGPGGFTGSSATISNVPAGSYSITVVDGNSCTGSSVVTVAGSATPITLSGPVNDALCGQNNGSLDLSANGGVAPYTFSLNGGAAQANGQFANLAPGTYTITVLDANACPATATYVINAAADVTPPTALCKNVTLYLDANGNVNLAAADIDNGSFDNCNSISLGISASSFDCSNLGANTVTLTVTDASNNSSSCTSTVTVLDTIGPDLHCMNTTLYLDNNGQANLVVADVLDHEHEPCPITNTWLSQTTFNCTNLGTNTVTVFATDNSNNTGTCQATVTVIDNSAPVADVANLPTVTGECNASVSAPTATDNCAGSVTATTNDATSFSAQGTYTINWTYNDGNGNTSSQTQTVVVDDVTAPVPNVANLPTVTGECSASVSAPTATDNCVGTVTATTSDATSYSAQGTYTITWTYDDGNGNTSSQTQTVVVDDVTAPVPDVANLPTVTGECSASVSAPTATDNCVGTVTATTSDATSYSAQGTYTITWTYDDGNGNTSSQTQTVVVDDVTAPVPDVANLPTVTGECSASVSAPTATDNCVGTVTATTTDATSYSAQGTYTITWTYDDGNGNTSSQTQTVVVDDVTAPVPDVANLPTVTGECSASVSAPTATDNCVGAVTATTSDATSYSAQGTYTITWTYDDGNGNTSSQTQTVVVDDVTAPVPDVANLPTVTGECSASVSAPTATDNCVGAVTATTNDATSYSTQGTYTITWTYDDGNGNTTTQTQTVIIQDVSSPVLTLPAPIVVNTTPGQCGAIVNFEATAVDNCAMGTLTYSKAPGTFFDKGVTNITVTATDAAGNITAGNINVTVLDNEAPTISCPGNMVLNNAAGVCGSAVTFAVTSADNCPGINVVQTDGLPSGSVFPLGVTSNTFVVTDASGNTATCSFDVTVNQDPNTVVVYTILASDEIHLHDTNMVYGNLGVWKANKKAKIHQDSYVYGFVQAPDIELNNNSSISGAQNLAQAPMPAANTFRYNTMSSNQNINVPDNYAGVYTITGNNFKKIEIGKNTTVKFMNVGDIYIDELKVKGDKNVNTNITFNGNTNLIIRKKMDLDKRNQFNQVGGYTVNVYVEESDVKVDEYSNVTANIDVRFKDLHVHGKKYGVTTMTGQFIGKKVHGHHLVRWNGACAGPNNVGPTPREWQEAEPMASGETSITARVYPNPNSGAFHVEVQGPAGSHIQAGLYDLTGKKITDLNGIQVNVPYQVNQPMANGVYFIHVDIDGQRQSVKLIRQD